MKNHCIYKESEKIILYTVLYLSFVDRQVCRTQILISKLIMELIFLSYFVLEYFEHCLFLSKLPIWN